MSHPWLQELSAPTKGAITKLLENCDKVAASPAEPLDEILFRESEYILQPPALRRQILPGILPELLSLLSKLQQDPTRVTILILLLLEDESFETVLQYIPPPGFIAALHSPAEAVNDVALSLLLKACEDPVSAAILSSSKKLMLTVVRTWLYTNTISTADKASSLLEGLLAVDGGLENSELPEASKTGQGLIWRRILLDEDIYSLIFEYCSFKSDNVGADKVDERQRSLAQLRLLKSIPVWAALDFKAVSTSHFAKIEESHGCPKGQGSLLAFALCYMVKREDFGMQLYFVESCRTLLRRVDGKYYAQSKPAPADYPLDQALRFLIAKKVHSRLTEILLDPAALPDDDLARRVLPGETLSYFATYADVHPDHFLRAPAYKESGLFVDQTLKFCLALQEAFNVPHLIAPGLINYVVSIPKIVFNPRLADDGTLSTDGPHMEILKLFTVGDPYPSEKLGAITAWVCDPVYMHFSYKATKGWAQDATEGSRRRQYVKSLEAKAARVLLATLIRQQPKFWQDISHIAQNFAMPEDSAAAFVFFASLFKTKWATLPTSAEIIPVDGSPSLQLVIPTETQLRVFQRNQTALPLSGPVSALKAPASSYTLSALLAPMSMPRSAQSMGKERQALLEARRNALVGLQGYIKSKSVEDLEELGVRNVESIRSAVQIQLTGGTNSYASRGPNPEVATMGS